MVPGKHVPPKAQAGSRAGARVRKDTRCPSSSPIPRSPPRQPVCTLLPPACPRASGMLPPSTTGSCSAPGEDQAVTWASGTTGLRQASASWEGQEAAGQEFPSSLQNYSCPFEPKDGCRKCPGVNTQSAPPWVSPVALRCTWGGWTGPKPEGSQASPTLRDPQDLMLNAQKKANE